VEELGEFTSRFELTPIDQVPGPPWQEASLWSASAYPTFSLRFAGCTFDHGLYRFHDETSGARFTSIARDAFPEFADRIVVFGFDWLGRQFAIDRAHTQGNEPLVLLLEPATGQALEIPLTFAGFHRELHALREPALAASFFAEWSHRNPSSMPLLFSTCVGYRVPLVLGGRDDVTNLEPTDMDVYWTLSGQVRQQTRDLPPGTPINRVSIQDREPGSH
jgi:hypothetical protein